MEITQLQKSDAPRLLQIWNEAAHLDFLTPTLLEEKIWDDPEFDSELLLGITVERQLVGWSMGVVRNQKAGRIGYVKMIAIANQYQSRGCGSNLLNFLEEQLFKKGAVEIRPGESNPNYLVPGLDPRYTKAWLMFQTRGYEKFGTTYNLLVPLKDQTFETSLEESRLESEGIIFKQAEATDLCSTENLLCQEWPAWIHEVMKSLSFEPCRVHLALHNNPNLHGKGEVPVVGFAAYDGNNVGTGVFGPMGTHPGFRGKGIGTVLLKRCLGDLQSQCHSQAVIPWVGPISFYTREVNARIDRVFDRYRKVKPELPSLAS